MLEVGAPMNKKNLIFGCFFVFLCVPSLFAQDKYPIDKFEEECINNNSTTTGMNNCIEESCKQWDAELNKYYKLLMGILSKEEKQELKDSQVSWLKYRDLETKFRMNTFLNNQGTMYSNMAMSEKLSIVKQRALELKSLYDTLEVARE
jgi:uncharacterized protein YecT (DUF1311 family)